ncbi:MAG TPA: hypothetical protein VK009_17700 [Chloroflexota bacterium]|nr:hypothetical protein [Chloroflexota bacterium]
MADLQSEGFPPQAITELLRDDLTTAGGAPGLRLRPDAELLKATIVGAVIGGIVGLICDWFLGMRLSWPSLGYTESLLASIFTLAVPGAIAGTLVSLGLVGRISGVRQTLAERFREDAVVIAFVDEGLADRAATVLRAGGAHAVRTGGGIVHEGLTSERGLRREEVSPPVMRTTPADGSAALG